MREDIGLFRGKRVADGEWVEGNLWLYGEDAKIFDFYEPFDDLDWYQVDPATIGEYTGLKDKNGVRMWEGSIVTGMFRFGLPFNAVVSFQEGAFGLMWYGRDKAGKKVSWFEAFTSICNVEYEVIGDVADNPELLEV
jgi:uncharacterized phage protein (TIGR01671 family)